MQSRLKEKVRENHGLWVHKKLNAITLFTIYLCGYVNTAIIIVCYMFSSEKIHF